MVMGVWWCMVVTAVVVTDGGGKGTDDTIPWCFGYCRSEEWIVIPNFRSSTERMSEYEMGVAMVANNMLVCLLDVIVISLNFRSRRPVTVGYCNY